jgi:hypothetical protein
MAGGSSGKSFGGTQFATGTLMWNSTDESYSWMLVSGRDRLNVVVTNDSMKISKTRSSSEIVLFVKCFGLLPEMIDGNKWALPGINITIDVDPSLITTSIIDGNDFKEQYEIREELPDIIKITCSVRELNLLIGRD